MMGPRLRILSLCELEVGVVRRVVQSVVEQEID